MGSQPSGWHEALEYKPCPRNNFSVSTITDGNARGGSHLPALTLA